MTVSLCIYVTHAKNSNNESGLGVWSEGQHKYVPYLKNIYHRLKVANSLVRSLDDSNFPISLS